MTNGPYIDMRLGPLKLLLSHITVLLKLTQSLGFE
jgi:hypothetical protein